MSFRSLKDDREHTKDTVRIHRKAGKRRSNSAPTIHPDKTKDINATDSKGRTSLYYAAKYGEIEIVRHLLCNGGDPDLPDKASNYPIHEAVDNGHVEVLELLIYKGCNVNVQNLSGQTPLMRAALFDDLDAVKVLIKSDCDLDEVDCTGKTALLVGLQEGHDVVSRYLIKSGCDVNVIDRLGQSALYFAIHRSSAPSVSLCQKLYRNGYQAEHDSDWLTKDLHRKLTQNDNGLFSRVMRKLRIQKSKIDLYSIDDLFSDDYVDFDNSRKV
ncbi:DAPK [Mytilus coruscus]|uniref:DAPK n=1 Tax=Mytilus coruscus TaxID=42192 RepID=A0A6J8DUZ9_MYTCO|nr:DAPK [Mytilus coruscus]